MREVVGKEHLKRTKPLSVNQINGGQALAELHEQIPQALEIVRTYRRYLHDGHATVEELAITKSLSKEPQAYRHQTLSMIAAQELLARGVSLQAGDTIHYIITDADAVYPPDRARAVAGLDGTWSYDVSAYDSLLLKAALVLLTPLGVTATSLSKSTDPTRCAAYGFDS